MKHRPSVWMSIALLTAGCGGSVDGPGSTNGTGNAPPTGAAPPGGSTPSMPDPGATIPEPGSTPEPPFGWRDMAPSTTAGLSGRFEHEAVWTGSQMIVWGGSMEGTATPSADGAAYDPETDTWRSLPPAPIAGRTEHAVLWTGSKVLIWGGRGEEHYDDLQNVWVIQFHDDGALFDPTSWTWEPVAPAPLSKRSQTFAAWSTTTNEALIWGGGGGALPSFNDGARYDPSSNTWEMLPAAPSEDGRRSGATVWDGSRMILFGGWWACSSAPEPACDGSLAYDPAARAWSVMKPYPSLQPYFGSVAGAFHSEAVFWGGWQHETCEVFDSGAIYRAAIDDWTTIEAPGSALPIALRNGASGWLGADRLWVWGGRTATGCKHENELRNDGAAYDLVRKSWQPMPDGGPSPRQGATSIWTGEEAIVWGGLTNEGYATDGKIYRPTPLR